LRRLSDHIMRDSPSPCGFPLGKCGFGAW
jgi:hypothetical protein